MLLNNYFNTENNVLMLWFTWSIGSNDLSQANQINQVLKIARSLVESGTVSEFQESDCSLGEFKTISIQLKGVETEEAAEQLSEIFEVSSC